MENTFISIVCVVLALVVATHGCTKCGTSGACCAADETCEATIKDGTCYKTSDKTVCNAKYYCYKPRKCCGDSSIINLIYVKTVCCPEDSKCCGSTAPFCCPLNSRCGSFLQCIDDSDSSGSSGSSSSRSSKAWTWYYIFIVVPIVGAFITVGLCLWIRHKRTAQAQRPSNRGVVYSRPSAISPSSIATISYGVKPKPPAYNSPTQIAKVPNSGTTGYGLVKVQSGQTLQKSPVYSVAVGQNASVNAGLNPQPLAYNSQTQIAKVPNSGTTGYGLVKVQSGQTLQKPPVYSVAVGQSASVNAGFKTITPHSQGTGNLPKSSKRKVKGTLLYL